MIQHHRRRPYLTDGVGYALPGDVGSRTVDGFDQGGEGTIGIDVSGRGDADRARAGRAEIGEVVDEQVRGDHDVHSVGRRHDVGRQNVDAVHTPDDKSEERRVSTAGVTSGRTGWAT